jgi:hypothetical protein
MDTKLQQIIRLIDFIKKIKSKNQNIDTWCPRKDAMRAYAT